MSYFIIGCLILIPIGGLGILAACLASHKAPEPETWAKCKECGWCYSSEGKIVGTLPDNPFITPELLELGRCPDCIKRDSEWLKRELRMNRMRRELNEMARTI